ncbi:class I SAM-dependent methyltransferase [Marichromatium sp. PS1]|uniref:class I SAM-dependent methyltransferase n=1 Tax=Marichromatium sp. PS1 TaxID=3138932 RepID=UPI0034E8B118
MRGNTLGNAPATLQYLATRRIHREGVFAIPHMLGSEKILDCGCGPGSITSGLAKLANQFCVGIDNDPISIRFARETSLLARRHPLFIISDMHSLPFPSDAFTSVFCHTTLMQSHDPRIVLREILRVLEVGGIFAAREPIISKNYYDPNLRLPAAFFHCFGSACRLNGGDPDLGARLDELARNVGFEVISYQYVHQDILHPNNTEENRLFFCMAGNSEFLSSRAKFSDKAHDIRIAASRSGNRLGLATHAYAELIACKER